jgi:hypothetical protein
VKTIEVFKADAINQIKFTYDDDQTWVIGYEGGKADPKKLVFTSGEYLVKVRHEKYYNNLCAGAAVHFETNKGRIFSYKSRLATQRKSHMVSMVAESGNEIIALHIKKGVLLKIDQQVVPDEENVSHPQQWYTLASLKIKNDGLDNIQTFYDWSTAKKAFNEEVKSVRAKKGMALVLVDTLKNKVSKKEGDEVSLKMCFNFLKEIGLYASNDDDANIWEVVKMTIKILGVGSNRDIGNFLMATGFLVASSYLSTVTSILTGHTLNSFSLSNTSSTKPHRLLSWRLYF